MSELNNNSGQNTFPTTDTRRIRGYTKSVLAAQDPSLIYCIKITALVERKTALDGTMHGLVGRSPFGGILDHPAHPIPHFNWEN